MNLHLVSFANGADYEESGRRLLERIQKHALFDNVDYWNIERIRATDWYSTNADYRRVLANPRGSGFWAWKPLAIYQALLAACEGDVVVWHDAGKTRYRYWEAFTSDLRIREFVAEVMARYSGLYAAPSSYIHGQWTKRRCLELMNCDTLYVRRHIQFCCYFLVFQNNEQNRNFVREWLEWCSIPELIDDTRHPEGEYPEFRDHRWEQSALTNMLLRYKQAGKITLPLHHIFRPPTFRNLKGVISTVLD